MEQNKDYSLLRPFDLEAAIAGEPILWSGQYIPVTFVARGNRGQTNIIERPGIHGGLLSEVCYSPDNYLRMAPLCWVEGRPVYKGDTLYFDDTTIEPGRAFIVRNSDGIFARNQDADAASLTRLTWNAPNPVLCEIEGKPVRKGDRLFSTFFNDWFVVGGVKSRIGHDIYLSAPELSPHSNSSHRCCSWKRKKEGFINIYPLSWMDGRAGNIFPTKEEADSSSRSGRIACAKVEWEEESSE